MKKNISTDPYKGVRDFYPEDFFVREHIFKTMRAVAEQYGYVAYDASVLEPAELYEAKTGEEIVNEQTYTFTDRGGRRVTLRPEMTPSVARMVARKRRDLALPLRWYSIPNLFRYERPQRGRLREHWQLNVDVFGIEALDADVEIIRIAHEIMRRFGLSEEQFEIRVNSRTLLQEFLETHLADRALIPRAMRLLDKVEKDAEAAQELHALFTKPVELDIRPNQKIGDLLAALERSGIANAVFRPTLTRGFDYYTDIVFEIFDTHPDNNRSLFGGGRYDNLLEIFGEEKMPAVGFGMGDVTIRDVLLTYGLLPEYVSSTDLCVCVADALSLDEARTLADTFRKNGLNVVVADDTRKVGDQIKFADRQKIPFVACVGAKEIESGTVNVKELATRSETTLSFGEVPKFIKNVRRSRC